MSKLLMLGAALVTMMAVNGTQARADNYAFCFKNDAGAGDCKYATYAQCLEALSGRDGYCQMDPYFGQRRR